MLNVKYAFGRGRNKTAVKDEVLHTPFLYGYNFLCLITWMVTELNTFGPYYVLFIHVQYVY